MTTRPVRRARLLLACLLLCGALPAAAQLGEKRTVEIRTTGIDLSYSVTEIEATAGETLTIRYVNESETMAHNVVVVRGEDDIRPVGIAALRAVADDYIPEGERDRIVAYSALARPGETVELSFTVPPPGVYPYICTYSGHFTTMQGRLISTSP